MNDPHVAALFYRIKHGDSVNYSNPEPFRREEPAFRLEVKDKQVCFELKDHYASAAEARNAIDDYIRVWEFSACLENGPDSFRLNFERAQIEDRNPPPPVPGVKSIAATFRGGYSTMTVKLSVVKKQYPLPPSGLKLCPDVQTMYDRYMGYRRGKEPLASMAYFCLTVLVSLAKKNRKRKPTRKRAAEMYGIKPEVLDKIGYLSSERGGQQARKAEGKDNDLTAQDRRFLKQAIKTIIRRVAEKAGGTSKDLPEI